MACKRVLVLLVMVCMVCMNQGQQTAPISNLSIYGVRWAMGDAFSFTNAQLNTEQRSHNYYTLSFNIDQTVNEDVYLQIDNAEYSCSGRQISVELQNFQSRIQPNPNNEPFSNSTDTAIYRCNVNTQIKFDWPNKIDYVYQIYTSAPLFASNWDHDKKEGETKKMNRQVTENRTVLFEGQFRPINEENPTFFSFGDWDADDPAKYIESFHQILPSLLSRLESNQQLSFVVFLGDIGYDLVGLKYFLMLKKMQPLTSRICFMTSPGNHDYIYHEESFELFAETFLSPMWHQHYNFYYTFVVGKTLFLQFSPDLFYTLNYSINVDILEMIQEDFDELNQEKVKEDYHLIVFSHYPVYCSVSFDSLKACEKSRALMDEYVQLFTKMGMQMYISGHVHNYERMHAICQNGSIIKPATHDEQQGDIYISQCPVYVVDGIGGSPWMNQLFTPKDFSAAVSYPTGFGIGSVDEESSGWYQIRYSHYVSGNNGTSIEVDKFSKREQVLQSEQQWAPQSIMIVEAISCVILMSVLAMTCYCKRYGLSQKAVGHREHVEMVEEQFHSERESKKAGSETNNEDNEIME